MRRAAALLCLAVLASACGFQLTPPHAPSINQPVLMPSEELSRILTKIDERGRFDYVVMQGRPNNIDAVASYIATFSPESDPDRFPTAASRLAYWINTYNVLVLYAVIDSDLRPVDQKKFYRRAKMMVGGRFKTLADIEAEALAMKDVRVVFALSGGGKGHPRLSRAPYEPGTLEDQLDAAARNFVNDPANVVVDKTKKVLRLSPVFEWHRSTFSDKAVSLPAFVNRYRVDHVPETYKVEFLPFDWTLNSQQEDKPASQAGSVGGATGRRL